MEIIMAQQITSTNNTLIKLVKSLNEKKYRKQHKLALIEGSKIIDEAIKSDQNFYKLIIDENKKEDYKSYLHKLDCEVVYTKSFILEQISPTKTPQGIVAVIHTKTLDPMIITDNFLVLDNVQDPGNLGAIIRTAAASGFNNIFMLNCVDVYNNKVIRASMGNLFKVNNYSITYEKLEKLLKAKENYKLLHASMQGENILQMHLPKTLSVGIIIGNEGTGVTQKVQDLATDTVSIPMKNDVESLNAAVSASIIMYQFLK